MTIGLISKVSALVGISRNVASRISKGAYKKYKRYTVPKKSGKGVRVINHPSREVKAIQRAIVFILGDYLPVHNSVTAYRKNKSILVNANLHVHARYLLKLDFDNFFPSINRSAIESHIFRHTNEKISKVELDFVIESCMWRENFKSDFGLCIGAPSSPFLSNSVLYDFDDEINNICAEMDVVYSRYSDDLTFSAIQENILALLEPRIIEVVNKYSYIGLRLNVEKRNAVSRKAAMRVTGLTLTNQGFISVGRSRKRGVRAAANHFVNGRLDDQEIQKLRGEISFVLSVEPSFRKVLINSYGNAIRKILPKLKISEIDE